MPAGESAPLASLGLCSSLCFVCSETTIHYSCCACENGRSSVHFILSRAGRLVRHAARSSFESRESGSAKERRIDSTSVSSESQGGMVPFHPFFLVGDACLIGFSSYMAHTACASRRPGRLTDSLASPTHSGRCALPPTQHDADTRGTMLV